MRILLTGVSGQVGGALLPRLAALGSVIASNAPTLDLAQPDVGVTDQEFAAVSSNIPAIPAATEARYRHLDYMERQFTKMVTA